MKNDFKVKLRKIFPNLKFIGFLFEMEINVNLKLKLKILFIFVYTLAI